MATVEAIGLGRRYRTVWALRRCSLRIEAGTIVGLVGPNGAGKSTLLNLIVGLVEPTEGTLRLFDAPAGGPARGQVAFTAQGHPLYRNFTVADMMHAGRGINTEWDEHDALTRLSTLDIPLDRKIGRLSGGQQAQVSLALALAKRPRLLVLDEPVAALDPIARRDFMATLMDVVADRELTVVLSSHVVAELDRVCDHLIAINRGEVQLAGAVDDLLAEHVVLTGPVTAAAALHRSQTVVASSEVGRQSTAIVRLGPNPPDPVWQAASIGLEELVLSYLRAPGAAALPGPMGVVPAVSA